MMTDTDLTIFRNEIYDENRDHVHAKKRDHVHAKDFAHSAGEQISAAGKPTEAKGGAS